MKCAICGGELEKKLVKEEVEAGSDRILAEVEAEVCIHCGERYFAEGTIDKFIEIKETLKKGKGNFKEIGKVYQIV